MIQFNLLPDVKLAYIKAQRTKRLVTLISLFVGGGCLFILVLLAVNVMVFQKEHLKNLTEDIAKSTATLKETPDLDKILTIQNQLRSLPDLHHQKPVANRLFNYLDDIVPGNVSISQLDVDYETNTMVFKGGAPNLSTVNQFADTMKFTTFRESKGTDSLSAFSSVVLTNFARQEEGATYELSLSFDPRIFDSSLSVFLSVPNRKVTSRSETEKPTQLFREIPNEEESEE